MEIKLYSYERFKLYIFAGLATMFALGSCVGEDPVGPTADRAGITSLTAYFTLGTYKTRLPRLGLSITVLRLQIT